MFKSMTKDFKSPVSTIPPRGHVLDFVEKSCRLAADEPMTERAQKARKVGTDAQNPAQAYLPIPMRNLSPSFRETFWSNVKRGPECWEWQSDSKDNYGRIRIPGDRAHFRAHRISYAIAYGVDPGPVYVCHKCDNPRCVRPDHLFLGTIQDNVDDMVSKGRQAAPRGQSGSLNGNAKMTEDDVRAVIRQIMAGKSNKAIAAKLSVGHAMVSRIRTGRSWRDLSLSMGYEPRPAKGAPKSGKTRFKGG